MTNTMSDKILFVDDESHILDSIKRQLRKRFNIVTAENGREALAKLKNEGPFSVVVSDMRMPEMNGIELLTAIKRIYPDTIRMMLTGVADQETAIEAVNKGQIFKFLYKPCPSSVLIISLTLALKQYRLVTVEKDLLDETLKGSIKVLSELLSYVNPTAFSSGLRIRSHVITIAEALEVNNLWQLEIAALLSQIGCLTLPMNIIDKIYGNAQLEPEESTMYDNHPEIGALMLENIPRLEGVAYLVRNQLKNFSEYAPDDLENKETNLGAQIIKAVFDYDLLLLQGITHTDAISCLQKRLGTYNPDVIAQLSEWKPTNEISHVRNLMVSELMVGMVIEENIMAKNNTLLAPKGLEITLPFLQGLQNFSCQTGVKEPIKVRVIDSITV